MTAEAKEAKDRSAGVGCMGDGVGHIVADPMTAGEEAAGTGLTLAAGTEEVVVAGEMAPPGGPPSALERRCRDAA